MDTLWARAEHGDSDAAVSLGFLLSGSVLPDSRRRSYENPVEAHMWFNLYLIRLDPRRSSWAQWGRGKRNALASRMTPAQITEVQRCAREWQAAHPC